MLHQPGDQAAVVLAQVVQLAEVPGLAGAEQGVVAAAALGDVVEQPGEVEQLQLGDALGDGAAQRELAVVLRGW
jgi:hypothetical protein